MHYMHVPTLQRKEYPFTEGKRKLTWLYIALFIANKESMVFHWLSPCQEGKGIFLLDSAIIIEHKNFGNLMQRTDSFEKTLMLGKIEGGRRRG